MRIQAASARAEAVFPAKAMRTKRNNILRPAVVVGLLLTALALVRWTPWRSKDNAVRSEPAPNHEPVRGGNTFSEATRQPPARLELVATLESIQTEPDPARREEKLERFAANISITDLADVLAHLQQNEKAGTNQDLELRLMRRWAESDPRRGADWALQLPPGSLRQAALREVAMAWAGRNLSEATAWVGELAEEDRQPALMFIAYETARTDPIEAMKLAMTMAPGEDRTELIFHTARQLAASDPKAAVAWARSLEDDSFREHILTGIATAWSESDAVAAAALAVNGLPPGRARDDAVVGIVQRWVQSEPQRAAAWVTDFPAGSLRDAAVENLVKLWTDQDAAQVAQWLNGLESGPGRDFAIETYVSKITPAFPESAAHWAESIEDEASRQRQMEAVGEDWLQLDQVAARTWIAQAALPEIEKARLLGLRQE